MRKSLLLLAVAVIGTAASAQLRRPPPAPPVPVIDVMRAEFATQSGGTTVYFSGDGAGLGPQARTILAAQAMWLRRHPEVVVRIEGHADPSDTRAHAIAVGARRAAAVRDYLILLGVPGAQISAMSWGKERPGAGRAVTVLVQ